jgi:hypothetical protein
MGALAAARRADAFRERIVARFWEWARVYGAQYSRDEWPDPFNAAKTDTVIRLLAEADASIPFTIARFDAHSAQIRADLVAWRDKANQEIVDKLAAVYGLPRSAATSSLDRASAVIRCVECAQLLFASGVMRHLHLCSRQRVLWAERSWDYDAGLHQIARALLHHAGLACDVSNEHVNELQGDLRCKCSRMGFLALVCKFSTELDYLSNRGIFRRFRSNIYGKGAGHATRHSNYTSTCLTAPPATMTSDVRNAQARRRSIGYR